MQLRMKITVVAAGAALVLLGSAACGGDSDSDEPSANSPAPAATQAAPTAAPTEAVAAKPSTLALVGKDILFSTDKLEAAAGAVTIEFDNQDGGVPHNVHVFKGTDATGSSLAKTELESGPIKQTLQVEMEAGNYFYVCDAHPTTMTGTISVD
ncbi:MAG: cupredoxin domain-containing protein [Chloroflexi bacterium]|nr:cupredoxin domain-containing protein [Chloroflexota bacterium]